MVIEETRKKLLCDFGMISSKIAKKVGEEGFLHIQSVYNPNTYCYEDVIHELTKEEAMFLLYEEKKQKEANLSKLEKIINEVKNATEE